MEKEGKLIYTVVVTYNGLRWIDRCLKCLTESSVHTDVIVVDNGSTDGTRDFVPSHYPQVIWMPQPCNLGFGGGNNIAIKYALEHEADYVLLLNQDAYLQSTAIEEMLKVADGRNLVSPVHLCGDGSRIDTMFRESLKRANNELLDDLLINHECQQSYEIGEVCAACWFMPIDLIKCVGGFNPIFFQYGEDNNYYTRMVYHGRKTILAPHARVWHDRKLHGNSALFSKKEIWIRMMVIACDPGLSLMRRLLKCSLLFVQSPMNVLRTTGFILSHCKKIMNSRKTERMEGEAWISRKTDRKEDEAWL